MYLVISTSKIFKLSKFEPSKGTKIQLNIFNEFLGYAQIKYFT